LEHMAPDLGDFHAGGTPEPSTHTKRASRSGKSGCALPAPSRFRHRRRGRRHALVTGARASGPRARPHINQRHKPYLPLLLEGAAADRPQSTETFVKNPRSSVEPIAPLARPTP